jgi:acyl-CoA reductase-like NAD-dependent aldehyde dehydrogenase
VQRILVENSVYGKFTDLLLAAVKKLKVGDPLDESSDLGPLIRESDAIRATDWIQEAVRGGARLLCGGKRKGSLLEPTVLTGTRPDMKVNCQEIFAPVVTVEPYHDFPSVLKEVNNSPYGLQAGLFTRDAKLIFQAYEELEVGGLIAGDVPTFRVEHMPSASRIEKIKSCIACIPQSGATVIITRFSEHGHTRVWRNHSDAKSRELHNCSRQAEDSI